MRREKRRGSPDYEAALKKVLEEGFYVLQRKQKKTGRWLDEGHIIQGRAQAYEMLEEAKKKDPYNYEWRVVQDVIAQAYAEGWKARDDVATGRYTPYDEQSETG
jgi:hypothetical protein